jgi:hypothetical protein
MLKKIVAGITVSAAILWVAPANAFTTPILGRGTWETTLHPRDLNGDGQVDAYYDSTQNVTWMANSNLAKDATFGVAGISSWGGASWAVTNSWIDAMNNSKYLGYSDWRLPEVVKELPSGGTTPYDSACWVGCTSELSYMYFSTLGNVPGWGKWGDVTPINTGGFDIVSGYLGYTGYWEKPVASVRNGLYSPAYIFGTFTGEVSGTNIDYSSAYIWVLRSGDVSSVPEPDALILLLAGAACVAGFAGRRRLPS